MLEHSEYTTMKSRWEQMRHIFDGAQAIREVDKAAAPGSGVFLHRVSSQDEADWAHYLKHAEWVPYTARCAAGYLALMFSEQPTASEDLVSSTAIADWMANVDGCGTKFVDWLKKSLAAEMLRFGRVPVLVHQAQPGGGPTPRLTTYSPLQLINWDGTDTAPTHMLFKESLAKKSWEIAKLDVQETPEERYLLFVGGEDPVLRYFDQDGVPGDEVMGISKTGEIPVVVCNSYGPGLSVVEPPLLEFAGINVNHYRISANINRQFHLGHMPLTTASGFPLVGEDGLPTNDPDKQRPLTWGHLTVWQSPDPEAQAAIHEFTGATIPHLEKRMEAQVDQMVAMGLRMLNPKDPGGVALQTVQLNHMAETSAVGAIAQAISASAEKILRHVAAFYGRPDIDTSYALATDYTDQLQSINLADIIRARQTNEITRREAFEVYKRLGLIPETTNYEDHADELEYETFTQALNRAEERDDGTQL